MGKTDTFVSEFIGISTASTGVTPAAATQLSTKSGFRNNVNWAWSATANQMDTTGTVMEGKLQFIATESNSLNAGNIVDNVVSSMNFAYVGAYDNHSGSDSANYGTA